MRRLLSRRARIIAIALWLTVPAVAATPPGIDDANGPAVDSSSPDVTGHAMPPPDIAAKPAPPPAVSANPLWAVPLSALAATRSRPLFTPSRRLPAPIVANAPVVSPARPPAPLPAAPERPNLVLIGTVTAGSESVAVFIDNSTHDAVRLRGGEGHMGWILQSVERRAVTLQKGDQTETLELPKPAGRQESPIVSVLPPPQPPPSAGAAGRGNPQHQGCMPEPVGC
jgi:hypothetical protein